VYTTKSMLQFAAACRFLQRPTKI